MNKSETSGFTVEEHKDIARLYHRAITHQPKTSCLDKRNQELCKSLRKKFRADLPIVYPFLIRGNESFIIKKIKTQVGDDFNIKLVNRKYEEEVKKKHRTFSSKFYFDMLQSDRLTDEQRYNIERMLRRRLEKEKDSDELIKVKNKIEDYDTFRLSANSKEALKKGAMILKRELQKLTTEKQQQHQKQKQYQKLVKVDKENVGKVIGGVVRQ